MSIVGIGGNPESFRIDLYKKVLIFNNTLESKLKTNFTILDYFVWTNNRLPNKKELHDLEKQLFMQLSNTEEKNKKVLNIAKKNNVPIFLKEKYLCNFVKKKCDLLTPDGEKIFWDYGHYTLDAAKYFGRKISSTNWFKTN